MRYLGQSHELNVLLDSQPARRFHRLHEQMYGYCDPQRPVEVVSLRVVARGRAGRYAGGARGSRGIVDLWLRRVHMYAALFLIPWVLMYAISAAVTLRRIPGWR